MQLHRAGGRAGRRDARKYAQAIDAWRAAQGFSGVVKWAPENDSASASFSHRAGKPGLMTASTKVDLSSLRRALLHVEPLTQVAVSQASWSKADLGFPPTATSAQGTQYWDITRARPEIRAFTGTITVAPWIPTVLGIWFLLPPLGVLISFGIALAVAKNESIPVAERRKRYGKIVTGGSMGVLMVHGLLVAATLPTRTFDPMAQLWFGQRFAQLAIPFVPLFAVVPIAALPFMNRFEKRLFGPSVEEVRLQDPDLKPTRKIVKPERSKFSWARIALLVVGFGLMLGSGFLGKNFPHWHDVQLLGTFLFIGASGFPSKSSLKGKFEVEPETLSSLTERLKAQVEALRIRMGMAPVASRVMTEAIYGKFGAVANGKGIGIGIHAMERLTPGEIDFVVAHELAHIKLGHLVKRRIAVFAPAFLMTVPIAFLTFGHSLTVSTPAFIFSPFLILIVGMVPYGIFLRRMTRQQEFEADRLAIATTGDPETAKLALRKITLNDARPGVHDTDVSSHPSVSARLAAM